MAEPVRPLGTVAGDPDWMRSTAGLARQWSRYTEKDVRKLVGYMDDLRAHDWPSLLGGDPDWPRFCRDVLNHDPLFLAEMEQGVRALDGQGHAGPVTEEQAHAAASAARVLAAAKATTGEVLPADGTVHPGNASQFASLSQAGRAKENGVSKRTQEKLDALARKAPEKLEEVQAGKKSTHRACVEAGIVKEPTPLDLLRRAWAKASEAERLAFLTWTAREEGKS